MEFAVSGAWTSGYGSRVLRLGFRVSGLTLNP